MAEAAAEAAQPAGQKLPIKQPPEYWTNAGDQPAMPWPLWERLTISYIDAVDAANANNNKMNDASKKNSFIAFLGTAALVRFATHPAFSDVAMSFQHFVEAARAVFHKPVNPVRAHFDFMQRTQGSAESLDDYLAALNILLQECGQ